MMSLLVSSVLLIYVLLKSGGGVLENAITRFFSGISMEIYLSHMVVFRAGEKMGLNTVIGNGLLQYIFTVLYVVAGATVFVVVMEKIIKKVEMKLTVRKAR